MATTTTGDPSDDEGTTLEQPLLRSSSLSQSTPPMHAFQIRGRSDTEEADFLAALGLAPRSSIRTVRDSLSAISNDNRDILTEGLLPPSSMDENDPETVPLSSINEPFSARIDAMIQRERRVQREWKEPAFGKPYARSAWFWLVHIPLAIFIGLIVGGASVTVVGITQLLTDFWLTIPLHHSKHHLIWLVSMAGGVLTSLVNLLFPKDGLLSAQAPNVWQGLKDGVDFQDIRKPFLSVMATGLIALFSGTPLGPELLLGFIATTVSATLASALTPIHSNQNDENGIDAAVSEQDNENENQTKRRKQQQVKFLQMSLAAAVTPFVASPLVGPVMAHEMSVMGERCSNVLEVRCDYMEDFVLMFVASLASNGLASLLQSLFAWNISLAPLPLPSNSSNATMMLLAQENLVVSSDSRPMDSFFDIGHILAAILMGLICGALGLLALMVNSAFSQARRSVLCQTSAWNVPPQLMVLIFPVLAAFFNALSFHWFPSVVGSGLTSIQTMMTGIHQQPHTSNDLSKPSIGTFVLDALAKMAAAQLSSSWGLVGGTVSPLIFSGACIGCAASQMEHLLPGTYQNSDSRYILFLCGLMAGPFFMCRFPVTAALFLLTTELPLVSMSNESVLVPVLVACIVCQLVVGGFGCHSIVTGVVFGTLDNQREDLDDSDQNPQGGSSHPQEGEQSGFERDPPSAEEMLENVRLAIFGG